MKIWSLLFLVGLSFSMTSCGNKNQSSGVGSSVDPYKVSTFEALINTQNGNVEIGTSIYVVSQQSYSAMGMAFQQAQAQGIMPMLHQGVYKYRAKITGSIGSIYQQNNQGGYQSGYNQPMGANTLNVTQVVIHR
jgi:hypothetical protein